MLVQGDTFGGCCGELQMLMFNTISDGMVICAISVFEILATLPQLLLCAT